MRTAGTHRIRRGFAAMLAVSLTLLTGLTSTTSARADDQPKLTVTANALSISGSKSTDSVSITATVTNTGSVPAYGVQARLWRSRDPLRDLPSLRKATNGGSMVGSELRSSYALISKSTQAFVVGATHEVVFTATLKELGFDTDEAAYAFGIDVLGTGDQSSNYVELGELRTFVQVPGSTAVPVTSVVLLSATPTKITDGLFRSEALSKELSGRLDGLLSAAAKPGMSWLIDPALLDEVRDQADGYQVADADGERVAGTGQQLAASWLARFDKLNRSAGAKTLFALPDLTGAVASSNSTVLTRAIAATKAVTGLDDLPLVVVPAQQSLNAATYTALADAGATAVLASNVRQAGALQAGKSTLKVLGSSAFVPSDSDLPTIQRRQLALAATTIASGAGQVRLLSDLNDLAQDTEASASWITRRTLGALLAGETSHKVAMTTTKPKKLSSERFSMINRLAEDYSRYAELVPESTITASSTASLTRLAASAWITDKSGQSAFLDSINKLVGAPAVASHIRLDASSRFVMSARSTQFPLTITNNLTETIQVKVVVNTENPQRLDVPATDVVTVAPGQSQTVNIRPEASGNGLISATAHVATEDGRRVSADVPLTIEVTELGMVAWIIIGVSGVVLVGATAWRIRQVRRRNPEAAE